MDLKPSPFAPTDYPALDAIGGFRLGVAATGVKYKGTQRFAGCRDGRGYLRCGRLYQIQMPLRPG